MLGMVLLDIFKNRKAALKSLNFLPFVLMSFSYFDPKKASSALGWNCSHSIPPGVSSNRNKVEDCKTKNARRIHLGG